MTMMTEQEQHQETENIRRDFINAIVAALLPYHRCADDTDKDHNPVLHEMLSMEFKTIDMDTLVALARALKVLNLDALAEELMELN
jgi:hypothetical protein